MKMNSKIYMRRPEAFAGKGYARLFCDDNMVYIGSDEFKLTDGTGVITIGDDNTTLLNGSTREMMYIDVKKALLSSIPVTWMWISQPAYRPGETIKGFIVARERMNPHVIAFKKMKINGQVKLVNVKKKEIIKAIPVSSKDMVIPFEIPLGDKKYMATGKHEIQLHSDGKIVLKMPVDISFFEKKEITTIIEHAPWICKGDPFSLAIHARNSRGNPITNGTVTAKIDDDEPIEKMFDGNDMIEFTFDTLPDGMQENKEKIKHDIAIKIVDDVGNEDDANSSFIESSVPASLKILFPPTIHSRLPVTFIIIAEDPTGAPIEREQISVSINREGEGAYPVENISMETDIMGKIEFTKTFTHEGTYLLDVEMIRNGERVGASKNVNILRIVQGIVNIDHEIEKKTYKEGESIRGSVKITGHEDTINEITVGYVDLVTDRILETKRVTITGGKAEYAFDGIMDFYGTAAVDFYIKSDQITSPVNVIFDKMLACNRETMLIVPEIPNTIVLDVSCPEKSRTGEEITIQVSLDPLLLKDDIHICGAIIDKRVITSHESSNVEKTFLQPPTALKVIVDESEARFKAIATSLPYSDDDGPLIRSSMGLPDTVFGSRSSYFSSFAGSDDDERENMFNWKSSSSSISKSLKQLKDRIYQIHDATSLFSPSIPVQEPATLIERTNFVESIMLDPVKVDETGCVKFIVTMPDAITTYDIVLFAISENRFGHAIKPVIVENPIFTKITNPAEMTMQEDVVSITASVYNASGNEIDELEIEVIDTKNVKVTGNNPVIARHIFPGESFPARFSLTGTGVGDATIKVASRTDEFSEIVTNDQKLFIKPPGVPVIESKNGYITKDTPLQVSVPVNGSEAFILATVNIMPDVSLAIIEGLEALTKYPYGCMEQTFSSTMPNIITYKYLEASSKLTEESRARLSNKIKDGIERAMQYQKDDGGFSYWGGESTPFYTALAVHLIRSVPSTLFEPRYMNAIKDGKKYISKTMLKDGHWQSKKRNISLAPCTITDEAMTAFVISTFANTGMISIPAMKWLYDRFNEGTFKDDPNTIAMTCEALLSCNAYKSSFPDFENALSERLLELCHRDGELIWWEKGSALSNTVESTARVIKLIASKFPDGVTVHDIIKGGVEYLLSKRTSNGWHTTSDTFFAADAISSIAKASENEFTVTITMNDTIVKKETLTADNKEWKLPDMRNIYLDDFPLENNIITVTMDGDGKCHGVIDVKKYFVKNARDVDSAIKIKGNQPGTIGIGDVTDIIFEIDASETMESVMFEIPQPPIARININACSIMINDECKKAEHVEMNGNKACFFFQSIKGKMMIHTNVTGTRSGKCSVTARAFEMYRDVDVTSNTVQLSIS